MEDEIRLTPNLLKTIGESTRLQIMKVLSSGPKIPSDISRKLNKSTPTILEHLDKLARSGLVEKQERPNKKYVFYSLTQSGQELISNKSRLSLILYSSIIFFILGISLLSYGSVSVLQPYSAAVSRGSQNATQPQSSLSSLSTPLDLFYLLAVIALVIAFLMLLLYVIKLRQIRLKISG